MSPAAKIGTEFLDGGGDTGGLIAARDWSATPLGPIERWPQSLRTVTSVLLRSPVPMLLKWGVDGVMLYNDAYSAFAGARHPALLGAKVREGWPEVADFADHVVRVGLAGGTLSFKDREMTLDRRGVPERVFMNLDYSPVLDDEGRPAGVLAIVVETTARVLAERRRDLLLELDERMRDVPATADLSYAASEVLGRAMGAVRAGYGVLDAETRTVSVERNWSAPGFVDVAGLHHFRDYGSYIDELLRGVAVANADVEADARTSDRTASFRAIGVRAFLDVPLVEDGRAVAQLFVHSPVPRAWAEEEIALTREVAARTRTAIARREAEARLRTALEIETVGAVYFDPDGTLCDANDAFLRMSGYSREDVAANRLSWQGLTAEEWLEDGRLAFAELRTTGRTTPHEKEYVRKDGSRWWALSAAKLLPGGTAFEFVLDVTERKRAEQRRLALVELSDRIRDNRDPGDLAYAAAEILGRALRVDRAGYGSIDAAAETVDVEQDWSAPGVMSVAGLHHFRSYGSYIEDLKRGETVVIADAAVDPRTAATAGALAGVGARSLVNMAVIEQGRLVALFYLNHGTARVWSDEELALIREVAERTRTAIERLRAEAQLREREARLRLLNETLETRVTERTAERDRLWALSQDLLARADYSGMMSAVSPAWTRILGWSEAELLSRDYGTFMHPADGPPTLEAIGRMAETGQPSRFENRIATRDGGWKHIEWTVAPEPDSTNFIAVGRDISLARAREAELQTAQEALRQSQKMEAMGQLTGGVAHDFNNLLTPIIGSLDMLFRKGIGSERERRLIDGALQSAERAKTLVQRLLAFARRQPLQPTAVDLRQLVGGMVGLLGSTLGPAIELRVDLPGDLPPAHADPNQLEMAILNLAVNARDAMPDGGELTIAVARANARGDDRPGLARGHYLRLSVRDTGMGMDETTRRRAIEPFFSTKGVGKGTGLGLSMAHGLAAQLGGGLTIDSAPGAGATIELWLPISAAAVEDEDRLPDGPPVVVDLGTALLVDDEELVRLSTAAMLGDLGYEVVEAGSAEDALRLIRDGLEPDLLVTDHLMPGMSGAQLARSLKATRPDMPVLIVSGYAEAEGVDPDIPRLTKPFRSADLAASLAGLS